MRVHGTALRNVAAALVLAALPALGASACGDSRAEAPAAGRPAAAPPVAVATAAAKERALPRGIEVTGTLTADAQTDVAAEAAGRVVEVYVERGQPIGAGEVLARLDPEDARIALAEAEATEAQLRARLGLAGDEAFDAARTPEARQQRVNVERLRLDHERYDQLAREGIISKAELDAKRTEYLAASEGLDATVNQMRQLYQQLKAQQAVVALRRKALADTRVRAPYAGVVAEKHATVGQFLDRGDKVATLVRLHPLRVELTIPESAIAAVRQGQKVSFAVQAYPDRRFEGTVRYVGPSLRPDSRALVAEALVPNAQSLLKPGLFATARIELPATRPSVFVPAVAVTTDGGVSRLYVVRDGRAEERVVQVGETLPGGLVEVVRGLEAGERVVVEASGRLSDGAPVALARAEVR